jgi:hypothetical protein
MPLPSYWWRQNFRGGCAQQRLETGLPSESPSVFPLYQWHWQILDRAERCCHCLGFISSGPSLWLCWWHCSHLKHSWMSTVPAKQIPQLHTFQGTQAQHWQNKSHDLLQQRYFCDSHLHVRWHTSITCHSFQIPWIHSHSWWKCAHSSWEDGR